LNILAPALLAGCFLSGSIPFSLLVGLVKGVDIRTIGSGNVGATNLGRALGRRYFFVGFALDMMKGLIPVLVAGLLLRTAGHVNAPLTTLTWVAAPAASSATSSHHGSASRVIQRGASPSPRGDIRRAA
jgi:glycerol-3-phosphate acyltransferase PlsY